MRALALAAVLLFALLAGIYRLAVWAKRRASQPYKDGSVVALLAVICVGTFLCFPALFAACLTLALVSCVASDFYKRKKRVENVE